MVKKAKLGFRFIGLDEEFQMPDDKDYALAEDREQSRVERLSRARKLRCYNLHKDKYNRQKRSVARSVAGRYKEAKNHALQRGIDWELNREEWERAWMDAGWVLIPGSQSIQNPAGDAVPAYALRGENRYHNTCMARIDFTKPWAVGNIKIMFRGEELNPTNRWYRKDPV